MKQALIREHAKNSAAYVLMGFVNLYDLNNAEIDLLENAAIQLFVKFYNGRSVELLTEPYVTAEIIDFILERELPKTFSLLYAVAQFVAAFEAFIAKENQND